MTTFGTKRAYVAPTLERRGRLSQITADGNISGPVSAPGA